MGNIHEELNKIFKQFYDYLNRFSRSEILQSFSCNVLENFAYKALIDNFFKNLTEENISEYNLNPSEVVKIRKHFSKTILDVKSDILPLNICIDKNYYENFKKEVKNDFLSFNIILIELEKLVDIDRILLDLKSANEKIRKSGNGKKLEIQDFILTKAIEKYVIENKDLPDLNNPDFLKNLSKIENYNIHDFAEHFSGMSITDWDIWHSYSSYFMEDITNLDIIAERLVEWDFCPLVFNSNTDFWYKKDEKVTKSRINIEDLNIDEFHYKFSEIPEGYSLELLDQSVRMWFYEWRLFDEKYRHSFPYIRCILSACYLKTGPRTISLYPQLKIYSNGVFILSFREISSKDVYYLEPFIENEINIFKVNLDNILVSPELIKIKRKEKLSFYPIHKWIWNSNKIKKNNKEFLTFIEKNTKSIGELSDFKFDVVPYKIDELNYSLDLHDLISLIIEDLYYVVNHPSKKIGFSRDNILGDFWTLRPAIYILEFKGQPDSGSEIITEYGNQLGKIMARVSKFDQVNFKKFLGKNLRTFEDYTLHLNEALSLWTMSKQGLKSQELDPNRGNIIYEKQIQIESIDHLYLSHKRLFEISSNFTIPYESVLLDQLHLLNLEELVTHSDKISNFGEIENLIKVAGKEFHWDEIRKTIEKKLKLRSEYSAEERGKSYRKIGYLISVIFGLFGASTFSATVITPIWKYYKLWLPQTDELQSAFLIITTIFVIILFIFIMSQIITRLQNRM